MKRYGVFAVDLDARALHLTLNIDPSWAPEVQEMHRENQRNLEARLVAEFGADDFEMKRQNLIDLGPAPFSIIAYHNTFLRQIRNAFISCSYYPALTGACALGERILNHLVLVLREHYRYTSEYKQVHDKHSFDDWGKAIRVLAAWNVLLPNVTTEYRRLAKIRNRVIHFSSEVEEADREIALEGIHLLSEIIQQQFSAGFGRQPWFIPNTRGTSFIKKEAETEPFIKAVYLPNCCLVGPYFWMERSGDGWLVRDRDDYEDREITDEEFADLYNAGHSG